MNMRAYFVTGARNVVINMLIPQNMHDSCRWLMVRTAVFFDSMKPGADRSHSHRTRITEWR